MSSARALLVSIAALFSTYHLILAAYSLDTPQDPVPVVIAMVLYAVVTVLSLASTRNRQLPAWLGLVNVLAGIVVSVLVMSQLDPTLANGYATWFVAAVSTLMVITMVLGQPFFAWLGIAALTASVGLWAGLLALTTTGVIGGAIWVAVAQAVAYGVRVAQRDVALYATVGLEDAQTRAEREATVLERQIRLQHMSLLATPMLRRIIASDGELSDEERAECLLLETTIRDEIRGRSLLSDAVRREILSARRRGVHVSVLDDGGLDAVTALRRSDILDELAAVIHEAQGDRLIIRTGAASSTIAVSVVGLRTNSDETQAALGESDDDVELWHEIARVR